MIEWSGILNLVNLLANFPDYAKKWKDYMSKKNQKSSNKETGENFEFTLGVYKELLITSIISYRLVIAFSKEHTMPAELVEYCQGKLKTAKAEIEKLSETAKPEKE